MAELTILKEFKISSKLKMKNLIPIFTWEALGVMAALLNSSNKSKA